MQINFNNKKKKIGIKGFTLVELLGTIVIVGILSTIAIVNVSKLITKARVSSSEANAKTMKMAAESYLQSNTKYLPKSIGESKNIDVNVLKNSKFIDKDLTDSKGKSCMTYSYVKVYKLSQNEYTYTPYLYCGDETPKNSEKGKTPVAVLSFSNSNDVSLASFTIKAYGDDTKKNGNYAPETAIDSFNYSISVKSGDNTSPVEVFNSGTLTANRKTSITVNKAFSDFIDISSEMTFYIDVTVINVNGEIYTINSSNNVNYQKYVDNVKPLCVYQGNGMAENEPEENSWINKKNYGNNDRVISVYCDDKDGSGCKRSKFSKSWPYDENGDGVISDDEKGVEYSYISIYDNFNKKFDGNSETGNRGLDTRGEHSGKEDCRVRVNVDLVSPSATLVAKSGNNIVLDSVKVNDGKETTTINATSYKKLVGTNEQWMNKNNYPNGVTYEVDVTDNLHLDHWKWETNAGYLNKKSFNENVNGSNPDSDKGDFTQPDMNVEDKGNRKDKIVVGFKTEGMRYGVLTIYDAAGNSVSYLIYANLDRTAPSVPTFAAKNINSNTNYDWNTWSTDRGGVSVYATGSGRDSLTNGIDLAGHKTYKYKYNGGNWTNGDTYKVTKQGKSTIEFIACDHADNCSASTGEKIILYDTINPVCTVTASAGGKSYAGSWVNTDVTVKAACSDDSSGSGCRPTNLSKTYNYDLNVSNAGAVDVGNGGVVYDVAGNYAECTTVPVKRDTVKPNCDVSGGNSNWTNKTVTIKAKCTDDKGTVNSGCKEDTKQLVYPDGIKGASEFNTTNAGIEGVGAGGYVEDKAGNKRECEANQTVKIDKTPPDCIVTGDQNSWTTSSVTVSARCEDKGTYQSLCVTNSFHQTYSNVNISNAGAVSQGNGGYVMDAAGNKTSCRTVNVKSDTKTPSVTSCSHDKNKFTVSKTSVGVSGLSAYKFTVNNSEKSSTSSSSHTTASNCGEEYKVSVKIKNGAGVWSAAKSCGTYKAPACCSSSNYKGCDWTTSCRDGNTFVYTSSSLSTYAGVVRHGSINDKLYVINISSKWVEVHAESFGENYNNHGDSVYIYRNCLNIDSNGNLKGKNSVCSYSSCPG